MSYILVSILLFFIPALIAYMQKEQKKLDITNYIIQSKKMNGTVKFILLSDLHNNVFENNNASLLKAIDDSSPDFIIIAGDMLTAKQNHDFSTTVKLLEELSKKYSIYYGLGNHEYRLKIYKDVYGDMYDTYMNQIKSFGIHVLENMPCKIVSGNTDITIWGLEIDRKYYKRFKQENMDRGYIKKLLGICNRQDMNVLIAHNPQHFERYCDWGADVILSGHVHGGVIRLPFLGGLISPQFTFFPKYDAGRFQKRESTMIISRGLGMHTIPVRMGNRCELAVVKMIPTKKKDR